MGEEFWGLDLRVGTQDPSEITHFDAEVVGDRRSHQKGGAHTGCIDKHSTHTRSPCQLLRLDASKAYKQGVIYERQKHNNKRFFLFCPKDARTFVLFGVSILPNVDSAGRLFSSVEDFLGSESLLVL